jgi:hypothetical protein
MGLIKKDHVIHDEEPDTGITLERGLVLPPLMGGSATLHKAQLIAQRLVEGCYLPQGLQLGYRRRDSKGTKLRGFSGT